MTAVSPAISRRHFLASSAAALGFPTIIPATALGKGGRPAPSERITVGAIGWGTIAGDWTPSFLNNDKCQVVAVADPMKEYGHYGYDGKRTGGREAGKKIIDAHYSQAANKPVKQTSRLPTSSKMHPLNGSILRPATSLGNTCSPAHEFTSTT